MTARSTAAPVARYFLAYLTANDTRHYQADFLHFRHMARVHPGVPRISIYAAVSEVHPFGAVDRAALDALAEMADASPWLELKHVLWKGNVGRDFSSAEACLRAIGEEAGPDDFVMVRNRSGYGPSQPRWYERYVEQYSRFPNTGLVGSTINFSGHPGRPSQGTTTHVQTYAYLSQFRHLAPLSKAYPAARCVDRLQLIDEGEIGLSRALLEAGLGLSCLNWPDYQFTADRPDAPELPQVDVKKHAEHLPIRYKYRAYLEQPHDLPAQLAWAARLWLNTRRARDAAAAPRHVVLRDYNA